MSRKVGVILVNTGTPDQPTPEATRAFLAKFLMDRRIRPMGAIPWWFILHGAILPKRSAASAQKYQKIWTSDGSPLLVHHQRLADALNRRWERMGENAVATVAMSYSEPSVPQAFERLREFGCNAAVVLPTYPQSAFSTTGSVKDQVARAVKRGLWTGPVEVVDNYHDNQAYIEAIAASVLDAGFDSDSDDVLLFSYHSIPLSDIEAGDTYELQTSASSLAIADKLGLTRRRWTVGYQCRFDEARTWLSPFTRKILRGKASAGSCARVFMVCPNFAVDCLETLYDVEHVIRPEFETALRDALGREAAGEVHDRFVYVACLNDSEAQVEVIDSVLAPYRS